MILLSVILPVYNGEEHIGKCIESIFHQTAGNLELIIINDGSSDASEEVIREAIEVGDKGGLEVRFVSQENQGVASARNQGIEMARGEYVMFVDQDDFLARDYCQRMWEAVREAGTDIAVSGYVRVDGGGRELYRKRLLEDDWSPYIVMAPWSHVYRTSFLKDKKIRFLSTGIGEDVYFNMIAYANTEKISVLSYEGYFWMDNPGSVSNTRQVSISKKSDPFVLLERLKRDMPQRKAGGYEEYFMIRYIVWYILYTLRGSEWKDVAGMQERLFQWLSENYPAYWKNPNISFGKPRGDSLVNRWSVWILVRARRLGLIKPVLRMLSIF